MDGAADEPLAPTFTWAALADAGTYTFELDDDPGFGSPAAVASGLTGPSHAPAVELDFDTTYFWRVRGENACGAGAYSEVSRFTTRLSPGDCAPGTAARAVFEDGFESGAGAWASEGPGDTWALSTARAATGLRSFHAADPEGVSDQRLTSPAITVPAGGGPITLQFWSYQTFETPATGGRCWDAGILEVSTDGGSTWNQVPQANLLTDPYDDVLWNDVPGNNPIAVDYGPTEAWCDELQPFIRAVVDLAAWAGQPVRFAWRLGSDMFVGNEGWYVDDVRVQSCVPAAIFSDGFESGDVATWSLPVAR